MDGPWISPSKIKTYFQCPGLYKYQYVDGNFKSSEPMRGGSAVHLAAERLAKMKVKGGRGWYDRLVATAEDIFLEAWEEKAEEGDDMAKFGPIFGTYVKTIARRVRDAKNTNMGLACAFPKKVEEWVSEDQVMKIRGIVDEITDMVCIERRFSEEWIVDLKTGKVPPVPDSWENWLQLNLYAAIYVINRGKLPDGMAIWYLKDDVWVIYRPIWDDINEAVACALWAREGIMAERFDPTVNTFCAWNGCQEDCDAYTG